MLSWGLGSLGVSYFFFRWLQAGAAAIESVAAASWMTR
jgi:hypothetical protein